MENKIKVLYIVGRYRPEFNVKFGGSPMEYISIKKAFEKTDDIQIDILPQKDFSLEKYNNLIKKYDLVHCDAWNPLYVLLKNNIIPDIIGPTVQSPTKTWERYNTLKEEGFPVENYYKPIVIRNNKNEEMIMPELLKKVKYINLGVDTDKLKPSNENKKYILWAGDKNREVKNFKLMEEIMDITMLPENYEFKTISDYTPEEYWDILKNTKISINTSKWESFCFTMFESESMGVPVIYQKGLHKDVHKDNHIQVNYNAEAYKNKILELLNDEELYTKESKFARDYTIKYSSYEAIRNTIGKIYKEVYYNKNGN